MFQDGSFRVAGGAAVGGSNAVGLMSGALQHCSVRGNVHTCSPIRSVGSAHFPGLTQVWW